MAASFDVTEAFTFILGVEVLFDRKSPLAGTDAADTNTFSTPPTTLSDVARTFQ